MVNGESQLSDVERRWRRSSKMQRWKRVKKIKKIGTEGQDSVCRSVVFRKKGEYR